MFGQLREKLFGGPNGSSRRTAKNRLEMVLVQDRSGLSSQEMDHFRKDLLEVIGRYFVLEQKEVDIEWKRSDAATALLINTPVVGRTKKAKKKKEEKKQANAPT